MSVGQDIVGDVFRADMASVGGVTGSGPFTYTEQYPGTLLGTNATATVRQCRDCERRHDADCDDLQLVGLQRRA